MPGNCGLLASGTTAGIDAGSLRQEILSLAGRDEREVVRRVRRILRHMLADKHDSAALVNQRGELASLFDQSPSLKTVALNNIPKAYKLARRLAAIDTGLPVETFPAECPYSLATIEDQDTAL